MSYKTKAAERRNRASIALSAILVFIMGFSLLVPLVRNSIQDANNQVQPTETPAPVVPTPIADLASINFDQQVVSKSGLFTVALPSGWQLSTNNTTATEAQLSQRKDDAQSVIEARVIVPPAPITDVAGVEAFFNDEWLKSTWRDYNSWSKAASKTEGDNYIINFNLKKGTSDYIGRQVSWTDGTWLYLVRVVTPPNATDQLLYILDNIKQSLTPIKAYVGAPFNWTSQFDSVNKTLIRFPSNWQVTDTAVGAPTSLAGDGATLRVETVSATLADEAAAKSWVESTYKATVTSAQTIDRFGTTGYAIAYQIPNIDGGNSSGYVVLLAGADGKTNVANLQIPNGNVDLNDSANAEQYSVLKGIMDSFGVFSDLKVTA